MNNLKKSKKNDIDFSGHFAVAVCIGPVPESRFPKNDNFRKALLDRMTLFDRIAEVISKESIGYEYTRNADQLFLLCSFDLKHRSDFALEILRPVIKQMEDENALALLTGIGIPAVNQLHIQDSLSSAKDAADLFFFEDRTFFEYQKDRKRYEVSFEDYEHYSEKAFKSILMKSPDALTEIDSCIDLIRRIHYGNKNAVIMRTMNFTGEMAYRLHRYGFLEADFYRLQDALQGKVLSSLTFPEMKEHILSYYKSILSKTLTRSRTNKRVLIEQTRTYIRENYMQPLTVKELAAICCVSPAYFSRLFKEETGQSCKSFLTGTRLSAALEYLLGSDLRLYEISEKVGYRNVRNFEEAFRNQYGCYPGDYKKRTL